MVLAHYGRILTEQELRQTLGSGPHGTRVRDLFRVGPLGFDVRVESLSLLPLGAALRAGVTPIVFLETSFLDYWTVRCDHVAVVVALDLASVDLNDPFFESAPQRTALAGFQLAWAANEHLAATIRPKT